MADRTWDQTMTQLYQATPEEFTALRTELAKAAKKRGDAEAAKQISGARKPTTAAWVVNTLVHTDTHARDSLRDLAAQLRDAHAEMDGERIRALSAEQRQLVSRLGKAAFASVELANPSAALRDDVTGTLQAAIADPEVAARLGTLTKAEQWSGFGFGVSTAKGPAVKGPAAKKAPAPAKPEKRKPEKPPADHQNAQRRRELEQARTAMAEARQAKTDTDKALVQRHKELAGARTRHEEAQRRLRAAERDLQDAEQSYNAAEQAGLDAGARIAELRERLEQLRA